MGVRSREENSKRERVGVREERMSDVESLRGWGQGGTGRERWETVIEIEGEVVDSEVVVG